MAAAAAAPDPERHPVAAAVAELEALTAPAVATDLEVDPEAADLIPLAVDRVADHPFPLEVEEVDTMIPDSLGQEDPMTVLNFLVLWQISCFRSTANPFLGIMISSPAGFVRTYQIFERVSILP